MSKPGTPFRRYTPRRSVVRRRRAVGGFGPGGQLRHPHVACSRNCVCIKSELSKRNNTRYGNSIKRAFLILVFIIHTNPRQQPYVVPIPPITDQQGGPAFNNKSCHLAWTLLLYMLVYTDLSSHRSHPCCPLID